VKRAADICLRVLALLCAVTLLVPVIQVLVPPLFSFFLYWRKSPEVYISVLAIQTVLIGYLTMRVVSDELPVVVSLLISAFAAYAAWYPLPFEIGATQAPLDRKILTAVRFLAEIGTPILIGIFLCRDIATALKSNGRSAPTTPP
jgi:hypothetical protein